jgi:hypothetical protein
MRRSSNIPHIKLDRETSQIKHFVLSLPVQPEGSILELKGEPVLRILPVLVHGDAVDNAQLKTAILRRRTTSRRLNRAWEALDRTVWEQAT